MTLLDKLIPRTLLVRTFLLVSLLLFVCVAAWLTLFALAEREPRARQLAQLAVSVVNMTNAALIAADPERRLALLRDLAESEGVHLYPSVAHNAKYKRMISPTNMSTICSDGIRRICMNDNKIRPQKEADQ